MPDPIASSMQLPPWAANVGTHATPKGIVVPEHQHTMTKSLVKLAQRSMKMPKVKKPRKRIHRYF